MIDNDLFNSILLEPAYNGYQKLCIVSGYATAAMAFHHKEHLNDNNFDVEIDLIIGMCPTDGLSLSNHRGLQKLVQDDFRGNFSCSYILKPPSVHSKLYIWFNNNNPELAFLSSANYTQNAFGNKQREIAADCNPTLAFKYFNSLISDSIYCDNPEAENFIKIYNDRYYIQKRQIKEILPDIEEQDIEKYEDTTGLQSATISLLDRSDELPERSGLNWGQRPEERREPNQAYIRLPATIYRQDFFPPRGVHFTLLTDDGKVLICSRAQDEGKAIHTPHNNSLIGEYFRHRLGIPSGRLITKQNLLDYGRTDITFYKIDDETYFMDFSVES